jgi:hypothetical protein
MVGQPSNAGVALKVMQGAQIETLLAYTVNTVTLFDAGGEHLGERRYCVHIDALIAASVLRLNVVFWNS